MRSFSITLLTILFLAAIVSASLPNAFPSSSSSSLKLTFEDLALDDSKANSELDELVKLFKCSRDVIGNVIGESDLKPLYEQYKREFDVVLQNNLVKCNDLGDITERAKCLMNGVQKVGQLFNEFIEKVSKINKKIAEKIKKDLKDQCVQTPNSFYGVDGTTGEPFLPSVIEVYECVFGVLGEVSKENGFSTEWQKYERRVKRFLDSWKQCKNAGGKIRVIWCNTKKYLTAPTLVARYVASFVTKPEFKKMLQEFKKSYKQKCLGVL